MFVGGNTDFVAGEYVAGKTRFRSVRNYARTSAFNVIAQKLYAVAPAEIAAERCRFTVDTSDGACVLPNVILGIGKYYVFTIAPDVYLGVIPSIEHAFKS